MKLKNFGLSEKDIKTFFNPLAEYLPESIVLSPEFQSSIYVNLQELDELADQEVCSARVLNLSLNVTPRDLSEKLEIFPNSRKCFLGARFRNGLGSEPFVEVTPNFRITDVASLKQIGERVSSSFKNIDPSGFTFWEAPGLHEKLPVVPMTKIVWGPTNIGIHDALPEGITCNYQNAKEFLAGSSEFVRKILSQKPEPEKSWGKINQSQIAFSIFDQDQWQGSLFAKNATLHGCSAIVVVAKLIKNPQLNEVLEVEFLKQIRKVVPSIWAAFDSLDTPLLLDSFKLQRKEIQTEYFYPLKSY